MGLFDKIFNNKRNQENNIGKSNDPLEINDLVFDWFKEHEMAFDEFEGGFYNPTITAIKQDERKKWYFENKNEEANATYFIALSITYLSAKATNNNYLKKFFDYLFDKNTSTYELKELLSRSSLEEYFSGNQDQYETYLVGSNIIKIYHAIHYKKDANFSYLLGSKDFLGRRKFIADDPVFKKIFNYINEQDFDEKPFYILAINSSRPYRRRNEVTSEENQFKELLNDAFRQSIDGHNKKNKIKLSYEVLLDYQQAIMSLEETKIWKETDYKKQKFLKVKDFDKIIEFLEKYKNKNEDAIQNILYIIKYDYIGESKIRLFRDLSGQLITRNNGSPEWLLDIIGFIDTESNYNFIISDIITPLLAKIATSIDFSHPLIAKYEHFLYSKSYTTIHFKGIDLLKNLCNSIEDEDTREFFKLKYTRSIASSYYNYDQHYLDLHQKDIMAKIINQITEDLNLIVPAALKSIKYTPYYNYEDSEYFKINVDGADMSVSYDIVGDFNNYFEQKKLGYRFLPIPVMETKNRDGKSFYKTSLAFVNSGQFELLKEYLSANFEELLNYSVYKEVNFSGIDAPPLYQLKLKRGAEEQTANSKNDFVNNSNWSWFREKYIDQLSSNEKWYELIPKLSDYKGTKQPNKQWLEQIRQQIADFGQEKFFKELAVIVPPSLKEDFWFSDNYSTTLKGIICACTNMPTDTSLSIVRDIISAAYSKIPGIGPRSAAMGNFGLNALTESGDDRAFGLLNVMRNKTKYQRFIKILDKYIEKFSAFSDTPPELLADKAIPKLGFDGNSKSIPVASYHAVFKIANQKLSKDWIDKDGKILKSIPNDVKENHPKLLKEVTEDFKQVNSIFKDLKHRVRTYWMYDRSWIGKDWLEYIYNHPFIYPWIEGLIWVNETKQEEFILLDRKFKSVKNGIVTIGDNDRISLWHPIVATRESIDCWQEKIWKEKIIQPERQAFREHYPFSSTEMKMNESPRFSHHFLEVKKLMAIANSAKWIFTYVHEDVNWPRIYIKPLDLTAHIKCDYSRMDDAIPTKELIITKNDTTKISYSNKISGERFSDVPQKTLSEICRDIDLFIATTSVAHNPGLSKKSEMLGGYRNDFLTGSFSENANSKIRKMVLEKIIHEIGLKSTGFEGNFLLIDGKINSYRINLGSGFAQIKNSQKHLNIIPDTSKIKRKYVLPIEDDETLFIILAKSLFLQNDDQITDEKIKEQIKTA